MTYTVFDNRVTVFSVKGPCPNCGQEKLFGYNFKNDNDDMMHTHYVCTYWGSPVDKSVYMDPNYNSADNRCGWHGWSVPGWDKDE